MSRITLDALAAAAVRDLTATWRDQAACHGQATLMDPHQPTDSGIAAARQICWSCPVLSNCREWVLNLPGAVDPGGIVAALTERERAGRRLSRAVRAQPGARKRCGRCHESKPTSEYQPDRYRRDGLTAWCTPCRLQNRKDTLT